ncbi:hypothetical protein M0657_011208 [Pyricularia oryzae]|uniref:Uncharacterized protein n=3 Tax=Pyricularia oryzae TaxID=318829 RepID=Q2KGR2_PYRO7|nr:hypothetical protein MGCH7_ch7g273 [Pyricularia oryzae 70-15]ELQ32305.1 hypothetical protein OOU_Y34scaffold01195g7 [Pyricularia oryzae Y34]KAI7909142.1 hypothetical protein M9X92_011801 [Pyricularia oryzae]KAI7910852.1 hypothetical protein M0657_011208 [Pyricularia oryzae]
MSEPKRLLEVAKQLRLLLVAGECLSRVEVVKLAVEFAQIAQRYLVADFPASIEKVENDEFRVVEFIIGRKADCSSPGDLSGWESKDEKTKVDMLEWCLLEVGILSNINAKYWTVVRGAELQLLGNAFLGKVKDEGECRCGVCQRLPHTLLKHFMTGNGGVASTYPLYILLRHVAPPMSTRFG